MNAKLAKEEIITGCKSAESAYPCLGICLTKSITWTTAASWPVLEELGNCHSILTPRKKLKRLKNQQLFLDTQGGVHGANYCLEAGERGWQMQGGQTHEEREDHHRRGQRRQGVPGWTDNVQRQKPSPGQAPTTPGVVTAGAQADSRNKYLRKPPWASIQGQGKGTIFKYPRATYS